jgi:hypothetical protein
MTRPTCTIAAVLLCAASATPAASTHNPGGAQRWQIPIRTFVGYSDEAEMVIVEGTVKGTAEDTAKVPHPAFRFCGDHYSSRRAGDGTIRSRLDLWVWQAPREGVALEILIFCRSVDPLVQLDPNLELPAEVTDRDKTPVALLKWADVGVPSSECHIRVPGPLIPGRQRVYLVDTESGWWCARDLAVSVGQ